MYTDLEKVGGTSVLNKQNIYRKYKSPSKTVRFNCWDEIFICHSSYWPDECDEDAGQGAP